MLEMSLPNWLDPKITMGNVITLVVMIVGFFVWGVRLEGRVDVQGEKLAKLELADGKLTTQVDAARELASNRQEALLTRLARIEAILERLDKRQ
jgi:hypothetical protein